MHGMLDDVSWTELLFGIAYLAVGTRGLRPDDEQPSQHGHG
jgi:hypothetical protein